MRSDVDLERDCRIKDQGRRSAPRCRNTTAHPESDVLTARCCGEEGGERVLVHRIRSLENHKARAAAAVRVRPIRRARDYHNLIVAIDLQRLDRTTSAGSSAQCHNRQKGKA